MIVNGWTLFAHPLFLDQVDELSTAVAKRRTKDPTGWHSSADAKILAAIRKLAFEIIPADPTLPTYRQGDTLGTDRKHWFRAKFGGGRFRLFFRYNANAKIVVYAWVNDEKTKRTYGSKNDAYAVFRKMLDNGNPPDDWAALFKAASDQAAIARLANVQSPEPPAA